MCSSRRRGAWCVLTSAALHAGLDSADLDVARHDAACKQQEVELEEHAQLLRDLKAQTEEVGLPVCCKMLRSCAPGKLPTQCAYGRPYHALLAPHCILHACDCHPTVAVVQRLASRHSQRDDQAAPGLGLRMTDCRRAAQP